MKTTYLHIFPPKKKTGDPFCTLSQYNKAAKRYEHIQIPYDLSHYIRVEYPHSFVHDDETGITIKLNLKGE